MGLELDSAYSAFEEGIDFTVGLEEEFALVDPIGLGLVQRFEELSEAGLFARSAIVLAVCRPSNRNASNDCADCDNGFSIGTNRVSFNLHVS